MLLIPGSGVRANMFYGQPVGETLAERLLGLGYDVWVENWRASIDFPPTATRSTRPHASTIRRGQARPQGEPRQKLRAVVHCQGSVSFLMACTAGYLDGKVSHVVSSAVSLFLDVDGHLGQAARRGPIVQLGHTVGGRAMGAACGHSVGSCSASLGKHLERPCDNPACQVANFMYGSGWDTQQYDG